ncbi:FadR/GntR family transcriptional regulator [Pedococcus sp.]|uniref:FadR/GntR family transcriptional regulator n=1 Tax=Pedococcus sp. TaxID=2860345 RepID=UPI002E14FF7A|nr:FCD domain-containing protein [Pedococcus sp.]
MSEHSPERGRGLHQAVVDELGAQIVSGALAPGTVITAALLGERMGVSRTVLREGIRVLESKGLVQPWPKTGTRVLDHTHWDLLDRDVIRWRVRGPDRARQFGELMDLRRAVEAAAARSCCDLATPEEVDALLACADELRRSGTAGDLEAFTAADMRFHALLLSASHNLVFDQLAGSFAATLEARADLKTLPQHIHRDTLDAHLEVARAIADRDHDRAERAVRTIVDQSRSEALDRLGS